MVKHVVCFKLKDKIDIDKTKEILLSMRDKVASIKQIAVNINQLHSERSFDIILEVIVEDWKALEEYQKDEYHCDIVKAYIKSIDAQLIALDYQI